MGSLTAGADSEGRGVAGSLSTKGGGHWSGPASCARRSRSTTWRPDRGGKEPRHRDAELAGYGPVSPSWPSVPRSGCPRPSWGRLHAQCRRCSRCPGCRSGGLRRHVESGVRAAHLDSAVTPDHEVVAEVVEPDSEVRIAEFGNAVILVGIGRAIMQHVGLDGDVHGPHAGRTGRPALRA